MAIYSQRLPHLFFVYFIIAQNFYIFKFFKLFFFNDIQNGAYRNLEHIFLCKDSNVNFYTTPGSLEVIVYEGKSRRGGEYNTIVAEIFPDKDYLEKNGITDAKEYFQKHVNAYNKTAVPYKKVGLLKVRDEEFPKNTLRKILRRKIDMTID